MKTPIHFLNKTGTIYPGNLGRGNGAESTVDFGTAMEATVKCRLFPVNSSESMQYQRETGRVTFKLLMAPTLSDGTAVAIPKSSQIVIDAVRYRFDGDAVSREPGTQGYQLIRSFVFRES